jgi:branched-chain amino acid transport system permease protein
MTLNYRNLGLFGFVGLLLLLEGTVHNEFFAGSWNTMLGIINMGLISAIMALGVNVQWGYAGLFNTGIVGFVALGGLAPVLVSSTPVAAVWTADGAWRLIAGLLTGAAVVWVAMLVNGRTKGNARLFAMLGVIIGGFFLYRAVIDPAIIVIESNSPAAFGNIGGLGLPVLLSWPVGALLAAGAAWGIGKTALGLRSDYLAIATLGIGEIIISVL